MYKVGDKFVIEIGEEYSFTTYLKTEEQKKSPKDLYRIKGFNSLVFDENGLDRLTSYNEEFDNNVKAIADAEKYGYEKGLNDGWECAKKICLNPEDGGMLISAIKVVFDSGNHQDVLKDFTPQEAIEKLKEWEGKEKFNVGDVIYSELSQTKAIIQRIDSWNIIECFSEKGQFKISREEKKFWEKTGEHVDLSNIIDFLKN